VPARAEVVYKRRAEIVVHAVSTTMADDLDKSLVETIQLTGEEQAILNEFGRDSERCLRNAVDLQSAGMWKEALQYCRALASLHPDIAKFWTMAGICAQQLYQTAVSAAVPASVFSGTIAEQIGALRRVRERLPLAELRNAVAYLNRALKVNPNDHMAWYVKAGSLCGLGMVANDVWTVKRGVECYDEAIRTKPDDQASKSDKRMFEEAYDEMVAAENEVIT
jgi:tetratricopeptide (TPR) repeat protein